MNINCGKKTTSAILTALLLILHAPGCGPYSFTGNAVPAHINTVAVPLFADQTSEFGVREKLTDAVIGEITRDNSLKITSEGDADAVVVGTIISLTDRADTFDEQEQAESYRVFITVEVTVQDRKKSGSLWKERWSQWGLYTLGDSEGRQAGIQTAIDKIAEDVLNKTVSGW